MLAVREECEGEGTWRALFARPEGFRFHPWVGERHRRRDVARLAQALERAAPGLPEDVWQAFVQAYLPPGAPAARRAAFRQIIRARTRRQ
jgi:hypothetical protein